MFLLLASAVRGFLGGLCRRRHVRGIRGHGYDTYVSIGREYLDPILHPVTDMSRLRRQYFAANPLLDLRDGLVEGQARRLRR